MAAVTPDGLLHTALAPHPGPHPMVVIPEWQVFGRRVGRCLPRPIILVIADAARKSGRDTFLVVFSWKSAGNEPILDGLLLTQPRPVLRPGPGGRPQAVTIAHRPFLTSLTAQPVNSLSEINTAPANRDLRSADMRSPHKMCAPARPPKGPTATSLKSCGRVFARRQFRRLPKRTPVFVAGLQSSSSGFGRCPGSGAARRR